MSTATDVSTSAVIVSLFALHVAPRMIAVSPGSRQDTMSSPRLASNAEMDGERTRSSASSA